MPDTFADLALDSMVTIGEVGAGEPLSPEDQAYCLRRYNGMIDSWSIDRSYLLGETIAAYPLSAKTTFNMGPSGTDITALRPAQISAANILILFNGVYVSVKTLRIVTAGEWQSISDETSSGNIPEILYCDFAFPNVNLNLNPAPKAAVGTKIELRTWSALTQIAAVNTVLGLAPGYYEAMMTNLGVAILDAYNKPVPPVLASRASDTLARVKALNFINSQVTAQPIPVQGQQ